MYLHWLVYWVSNIFCCLRNGLFLSLTGDSQLQTMQCGWPQLWLPHPKHYWVPVLLCLQFEPLPLSCHPRSILCHPSRRSQPCANKRCCVCSTWACLVWFYRVSGLDIEGTLIVVKIDVLRKCIMYHGVTVIGFSCTFLAFVYGIRLSQPHGLKYWQELIWRLGGLGQGRQIYFFCVYSTFMVVQS